MVALGAFMNLSYSHDNSDNRWNNLCSAGQGKALQLVPEPFDVTLEASDTCSLAWHVVPGSSWTFLPQTHLNHFSKVPLALFMSEVRLGDHSVCAGVLVAPGG